MKFLLLALWALPVHAVKVVQTRDLRYGQESEVFDLKKDKAVWEKKLFSSTGAPETGRFELKDPEAKKEHIERLQAIAERLKAVDKALKSVGTDLASLTPKGGQHGRLTIDGKNVAPDTKFYPEVMEVMEDLREEAWVRVTK